MGNNCVWYFMAFVLITKIGRIPFTAVQTFAIYCKGTDENESNLYSAT